MTDRDHFAAAALTGMLANEGDGLSLSSTCQYAYRIADAMLREREQTAQKMAESDSVRAACTDHDAAPAARAEDVLKEPNGSSTGEPGGEPESTIRTGKQPAPPCVEADGFSPGSRTGPINRTPERESPRRECGESSLRDVTQPDNGRAAGGPEHRISDRSQPVKDAVFDRSQPINDDRLAALEQLSALDQELEARHGLQGNPMIKARRNNESI